MHLLDTSVVVAALAAEAASGRVAEWLASHDGQLCVTAWLEPELSAALAMKQRLGVISAETRLASLRLFDDMQHVVFDVTQIEQTDFEEAARLCDDIELGLKAPDALHVAVAIRLGVTLATLDRKMARAAGLLGLEAISP